MTAKKKVRVKKAKKASSMSCYASLDDIVAKRKRLLKRFKEVMSDFFIRMNGKTSIVLSDSESSIRVNTAPAARKRFNQMPEVKGGQRLKGCCPAAKTNHG